MMVSGGLAWVSETSLAASPSDPTPQRATVGFGSIVLKKSLLPDCPRTDC
jgi:hypothetical protein